MRLYAILDRILPRSYLAKAVAVAVVLGQGPLLLLLVAKAGGLIAPPFVLPALLATMIAAFVGLGLGLAAIIRPVARLEAAFTAFEAGRTPSAGLPEHHRDAVGRLMAQANRLMHTAETRIDAARRLADRDPLTGLLNRRGLERSLSQRQQTGARGAVLMLDLDHFKRVNDVHGHDVGDRVLRDLARLVSRQMRRPDLAARFGGEEFVIYLSDLGQDAALRVAERVRMSVEDHLRVAGEAQTVSIGVAPWPPGESFDAILKRADMAVYAAKAAGRNRVYLVPAARSVERRATDARQEGAGHDAAARADAAEADTGRPVAFCAGQGGTQGAVEGATPPSAAPALPRGGAAGRHLSALPGGAS